MPTDLTAPAPAPAQGHSRSWLPDRVDRRVRVAGWISFITEILILGTGGAVRLTGSGLGCEWPLCAPDSLVPVAGMSLHSYIEFGNRLMTGVVGLAALAVLILVWRLRHQRRDLFALAWIAIGGILLQAILGGITVLADLNVGIVSVHFFASLLLVAVTAAFVMRSYTAPGPQTFAVPHWHVVLTRVTAGTAVVTLAVGILTTASGPHSGDKGVVRHLWDPEVMAHVHSVPGYALLALSIAMAVSAAMHRLATLRWSVVLLALLLVQVPLGVYQARTNLPALAVGAHMILAGLITAAVTVLVMRLRTPTAR